MDIRASGKNLRVTAGIREHLEDKLSKLNKYSSRIIEAHVVLKKEKYLYTVQITLLGKDLRVYGEDSQKDNIYAVIDLAVDRVQKQLKKVRDKIKDHHKRGARSASPKEQIAEKMLKPAEGSGRPAIIEMPEFAPKPMSVQEASLQLDLAREPFLVFSNAATQRPNVIFKREDGNHGLIIPEF